MGTRQLLIGGDWADGGDGTYDIVNPATETVVDAAPEASVAQALDAARAAREAFDGWSRTKPEVRAELLAKTADAIKARFEDLLPLVIAETGCTATVGKQMQVPTAWSRFETYARLAVEPHDTIPLPPQEMPGTALAPGGWMGAMVRRAPVGVVACITPYHFPIGDLAGQL